MEMRRTRVGMAGLITLFALSAVAEGARDTRLVDAVMRQDTAAVPTLLNAGVDVNTPQTDGATALHWAAHWDDEATADLLLAAGSAVNAANELGATPLWLACLNASPAMVNTLLKAGANPNLVLPSGETPLMTAALSGHPEIVNALLSKGAEVDQREGSQGQTALMWAVAAGHAPVVRLLIEFGANIHARSDVRRRRIGTELGGYDAAAAREIDKGGFTPLLFATQQGTLESVKLLIAAGADVNETAPEGISALVVAAHSGHGAVAAFLLEKGADPNASGAGYTALHAAILRGDATLVKALLARGADPDAPLVKATPARRNSADYALEFDLVGGTPFWLSAQFIEPAIMEILVANGADTTFVMTDGTTPVMAAIQARRRAEPGLTPDPIRDEQRALDTVTRAIDQGVDVNAAKDDGNTALHIAVSRRLSRVIEFLIERGARLDVENKKGQTPLALATAGGVGARGNLSPEILRKLGAKE